MRAITYDRYTDASGLELTDEPKPTPAADQVLIRVAAASLNALDWHSYGGDPYFWRLEAGLRVKERRTVGADVAGVVEAVGAEVDSLAVGDRVFGEVSGSLADYVLGKPTHLARIPDGVSDEAAAATPVAGLTALQSLRDTVELKQGESVIVWGASGGVGHLAVQVAAALGAADVHGVCSTANVAMVESCGASRVYDYTKGETPDGPYDVIVDTVVTTSNRAAKKILTDAGRLVVIGAVGGSKMFGPVGGMLRRMIGGKFVRLDARGMLAKPNTADLEVLGAWLADGSLKPAISDTVPLADAPAALARVADGHVAGKIVVRVAELG